MKARYKVPVWLLVIGLVRGLTTGGFDLDAASANGGQTQEARLGGAPLAPAGPAIRTRLCPAGCPHYPGDAAPREARAVWMGSAAQQRGLPPELPVMAALVESGEGMVNLSYGDADSVGLFQMRVSIWGRGEYAGYPSNPNIQLDWFLDHAEAVKADRAARGLPLGPGAYGVWIADVERPAERYRYRYQLRLNEARSLLQPK